MPTLIDALRKQVAGKPQQEAPEAPSFNVQEVRQAVQMDQGLTAKERNSLLNELDDPEAVARLKAGGMGAVITFLTAKFLRLKPSTQLLLSIAGFGLGKIIHEYRNSPKFAPYNTKTKMYEISD